MAIQLRTYWLEDNEVKRVKFAWVFGFFSLLASFISFLFS